MGLIYGINPVIEAIETGKTINKIYAIKGSKEVFDVIQKAKEKKIVTVQADKTKLDYMVTKPGEKLKNSQGIVASITDYNYYEIEDIIEHANSLGEKPRIMILDKIEDPHNLGAIIRSAECLGFHGVIIQKRNATQVTDIVEKTSAGAVSYMRIARVTNITSAINDLKKAGLWIYGLDMEGATEIYETDLTGAVGIVVGNEGEGISRLVRENCDGIIKIPMVGKIESLNASVSAAITMYEILKQNIKNN
ncbi:MAG: 23S rRNA (guanosine(2251)-2'-O)-methyltransferase RlmB [Clostridia bacterium]|nr:23S rRNA (guanosine(2251)-2'-O)-methyltransferase RlmB [Clostridia bacterium]